MRKKGNTFVYREERKNSLLRTYKELLPYVGEIPHDEMLVLITQSPSERFWVSEERALDIIKKMVSGEPITIKRETTTRMFKEILRRVKDLGKRYPNWDLARLVCDVISKPAPEFYITPKSAAVILHRFKKEEEGDGKRSATREC